MTLDFKATRFYSQAYWYRRDDNAASIAERFARYIDTLQTISPILSNFFVRTKRTATPYAIARPNLESFVRKGLVARDDIGEIRPREGYSINAFTRRKDNFDVSGFVGRNCPSPDLNNVKFSTDLGFWPDLSLMTYPLFRATTLATIACWEPLICTMQPSTLHPFMARGNWYHESWLTYVHPSLVHRVEPPKIPVVEPTPDGGLLLAATTETFSVDNPDHLEAARRIARATRHLDDVMPILRYPTSDTAPSTGVDASDGSLPERRRG